MRIINHSKLIILGIFTFYVSFLLADCKTSYEQTLLQYEAGIKTANLLIGICDQKSDTSPECKQAQSLIKNFNMDPLLKYLDQNCPNIYDNRFLKIVKIYSDVLVETQARDIENRTMWRGCKKKIIKDNNEKLIDIKCEGDK